MYLHFKRNILHSFLIIKRIFTIGNLEKDGKILYENP